MNTVYQEGQSSIYDNLDDKEQKVQRMVNDIYRVVNEDNIFDKLADMFGQN